MKLPEATFSKMKDLQENKLQTQNFTGLGSIIFSINYRHNSTQRAIS